MYRPGTVKRFDFPTGRAVAGKYVIERPLGSGWEGEVYAIVERNTGIRRAAKFYYPHRDPLGKAAITYARKLDALRHCPILIAVSPPGGRPTSRRNGSWSSSPNWSRARS